MQKTRAKNSHAWAPLKPNAYKNGWTKFSTYWPDAGVLVRKLSQLTPLSSISASGLDHQVVKIIVPYFAQCTYLVNSVLPIHRECFGKGQTSLATRDLQHLISNYQSGLVSGILRTTSTDICPWAGLWYLEVLFRTEVALANWTKVQNIVVQ